MLVDNSVYRNAYDAPGNARTFTISFPFLDASHIAVYQKIGDADEVKVPASQYTISGAGNPHGGTLTMNTTPAAGTRIVILRDIPITQLYNYTELDNFPAEAHENALAKLTMICQQLYELTQRHLAVPATSSKTSQQVMAEIFDTVAVANEYAAQAEKTYDEVVKTAAQVAQAKASVDVSLESINNSETVVTGLAGQVLELEDEVKGVAANLGAIQVVQTNTDAISAIASDLQGYPIYEFDGGYITDPIQPMNGVGGVLKIVAENIEIIKQVAGSLQNS
ncbi:MAG: hypothetical protein IKW47_00190, partial [Alistipes sp.]|nr:hypothetical protein [Alistipes sp.]